MNVCLYGHLCPMTQDRAEITDEIRIEVTLSGFNWLDIADRDTKRQIKEI